MKNICTHCWQEMYTPEYYTALFTAQGELCDEDIATLVRFIFMLKDARLNDKKTKLQLEKEIELLKMNKEVPNLNAFFQGENWVAMKIPKGMSIGMSIELFLAWMNDTTKHGKCGKEGYGIVYGEYLWHPGSLSDEEFVNLYKEFLSSTP